MTSQRQRAIAVLGKALRKEYRAIFLYRVHARAIRDDGVRLRFTQFGDMESEHATLLGERLTQLGGTISWSFKPGNELAKPLRQVLEEHAQGEREALALYKAALDEHLGQEYDDLFSRLMRDEENHLRVLTELLSSLSEP